MGVGRRGAPSSFGTDRFGSVWSSNMASPEESAAIWRAMMDDEKLEAALEQAERETLLRHKRLGQPIVVWRDGKVVHVPAEEIEVDENGDDEKEKRS